MLKNQSLMSDDIQRRDLIIISYLWQKGCCCHEAKLLYVENKYHCIFTSKGFKVRFTRHLLCSPQLSNPYTPLAPLFLKTQLLTIYDINVFQICTSKCKTLIKVGHLSDDFSSFFKTHSKFHCLTMQSSNLHLPKHQLKNDHIISRLIHNENCHYLQSYIKLIKVSSTSTNCKSKMLLAHHCMSIMI